MISKEIVIPWVAGSISGAANLAVGHPFDTIKVRLQTQSSGAFKGPIDCLRKLIVGEGILGLYKGVTPPLLTKGAIHAMLFGVYSNSMQYFQGRKAVKGERVDLRHCLASGAVAGWATVPLVTPIDQVKAYLQVQYKTSITTKFRGVIDCTRTIVASRGVFGGLYRYTGPTALEMTCMGPYYAGYEISRRFLEGEPFSTAISSHKKSAKPSFKPFSAFMAGGIAGMFFWLPAFPIETVKFRLMTQPLESPRYHGFVHCAQSLLREEGFLALWRGFAPAILRNWPANGVTFLTFEIATRTLSSL